MTDVPDDLGTREPAQRLDNRDASLFGQTPSQTVGPFFHYGLPWKGGADLVGVSELGARADLFPAEHYILAQPAERAAPRGDVVEVAGRILDAESSPVPDAMVEIWQANSDGRYASPDDRREVVPLDPNFIGFGRSSTNADGSWRFRTIRPGRVPGPGNSLQAPHVALSIFGRGLLKRLPARLYFAGDPANAEDPIMALVPEERRSTLIAEQQSDGSWWLDIRLGGAGETVFFDL
ncbi:MAG: protocatechuate 3,4-dioxygenase subunit alpha [Sphingopyxis sp.]|nr:protocatechuate 3,4-dioxygenase subunit alpha [Sphingopyxis sp.]